MNLNVDKLSNTTKNIFYIIGIVAMGTIAYNQIFANEAAIKANKHDTDIDISQLKKELIKEQAAQSARSDKRYKRAMSIAKDHEDRLRENHDDIIYIKGKEGY